MSADMHVYTMRLMRHATREKPWRIWHDLAFAVNSTIMVEDDDGEVLRFDVIGCERGALGLLLTLAAAPR